MDILKTLPDQPLTFKIDEDTYSITILSQNGKYKLIGEPGDEFPNLPSLDSTESFSLDSDTLARAIEKTLFATSTDDLRLAMTGVFFNLQENDLTLVATDAQKLVKYSRTDLSFENPTNFILPRKALGLLKNGLPNETTSVQVTYDNNSAFFAFAGVQLTCRLIEARYPDYNAVIPNHNPNILTFNRVDFT